MSHHPVSAEADTALHVARSKCIDRFARVELALLHVLSRAKLDAATATYFTNKVSLAREITAQPSFSKANVQKLKGLLTRCETAAIVRNDLAHAPLRIARIDGESFACFVNPLHISTSGAIARIFTSAMLNATGEEFKKLAIELEALAKPSPPSTAKSANPPPSPPPPSLGAAGGP